MGRTLEEYLIGPRLICETVTAEIWRIFVQLSVRQLAGRDQTFAMIEARPQGAADAMRAHLRGLKAGFPSTADLPPAASREKERAP